MTPSSVISLEQDLDVGAPSCITQAGPAEGAADRLAKWSQLRQASLSRWSGPVGARGLFGLWLSRLVLFGMTVGVPLLFAANIIGDGGYGIAAFFIAMAMAGLVFSLTKWGDPPLWAVMIARATAYRDNWHRP